MSKEKSSEILAVTIKLLKMALYLTAMRRKMRNLWQITMNQSNSRCLITTVSRAKEETNSKNQKMMSKIVTMMRKKERMRVMKKREKKSLKMKMSNFRPIIDFQVVSILRPRATIVNLTRR